MWSFPVVLLAIALGTALAISGLERSGSIKIKGDHLDTHDDHRRGLCALPRAPIRGQVLSLREKEFVEAAVAQGMGSMRIMFTEILPNLTSTLLVFSTLIVANNILLETALSYLGAGILPPEPSWGNLIGDGAERIVDRAPPGDGPGLRDRADGALAEHASGTA